jgi:hypothetical protein
VSSGSGAHRFPLLRPERPLRLNRSLRVRLAKPPRLFAIVASEHLPCPMCPTSLRDIGDAKRPMEASAEANSSSSPIQHCKYEVIAEPWSHGV